MEVNKAILGFVKVSFSILLILLIVYGTTRVTIVAYDFGYRVFTESPVDAAPGTDVVVTIEESMGAKEIGLALKEKGLIRDENLFFFQLKLSAYANEIRPGTYLLNTSMTAKEMMVLMAGADEESTEEDSTEASTQKDTEASVTTETATESTEESTGE